MAVKADKSKCEHFARSEWKLVQQALQDAIKSACVSEEFRGNFPARVWAFINDTLHEARLTNSENGEYHGFPVDYPVQWPDDPNDQLRNARRASIALNKV
jgi:hypothetical protein